MPYSRLSNVKQYIPLNGFPSKACHRPSVARKINPNRSLEIKESTLSNDRFWLKTLSDSLMQERLKVKHVNSNKK